MRYVDKKMTFLWTEPPFFLHPLYVKTAGNSTIDLPLEIKLEIKESVFNEFDSDDVGNNFVEQSRGNSRVELSWRFLLRKERIKIVDFFEERKTQTSRFESIPSLNDNSPTFASGQFLAVSRRPCTLSFVNNAGSHCVTVSIPLCLVNSRQACKAFRSTGQTPSVDLS